jgi:hypothetical protein
LNELSVLGNFDQAVAAHQALQNMLAETLAQTDTVAEDRRPPRLDDEFEVVRDLVARLQRLGPELEIPTGLIEFSVKGVPLDNRIGLELVVELMDPDVSDPNAGLHHHLPRLVPLRQDAPVSICVLAGTYRLRANSHHARWEDSAAETARRLEVDLADWPTIITVGPGNVTLPPIQLRLSETIELLQPTDELVKLPDAVFQWQEIPEAVRYQVVLQAISEHPHRVVDYFLTVTTTTNRLEISSLNESQQRQLRDHWPLGSTGGWMVDAYDAQARRIGRTMSAAQFVIAQPLTP